MVYKIPPGGGGNHIWALAYTTQKRCLQKRYSTDAPSQYGWLCWGLTSQSTIFQSCRDGAIASWVINQYFRGVKCLAQGHNTAAVGLEPRTSRSGVRHSTTEPPRSPLTVWSGPLFFSKFKKGIILLERTASALSRLCNLHSNWRVNNAQHDTDFVLTLPNIHGHR